MARALPHVRDAVPDDAPALLGLWTDLLGAAGPGAHSWALPTVEGVRTRLKAVADDPDRRVLVASVDASVDGPEHEQVGGFALLLREPLTPLHDELAVRVSHLHVLAAQRRHGVGHALVATATDWAAESGADHVVVDVPPAAREANRFYARLGFAALLVQRSAPVATLVRRRLAEPPVAAEDVLVQRVIQRARARARVRALR